mmetsp:Transcript_7880/g.31210  ORF Transcript_7880/g.31210 Transcript_7880/m.31210 type:complete len:220 (-) Transcript_7880:1040-1699(-)
MVHRRIRRRRRRIRVKRGSHRRRRDKRVKRERRHLSPIRAPSQGGPRAAHQAHFGVPRRPPRARRGAKGSGPGRVPVCVDSRRRSRVCRIHPRAAVQRQGRARGVGSRGRNQAARFRRGRGRRARVRDAALAQGARGIRHRPGRSSQGARDGGGGRPRRGQGGAGEGRPPPLLRAAPLRPFRRRVGAGKERGGRVERVTPDAGGVRLPEARGARRDSSG